MPAIFAAIGTLPFTTSELMRHNRVAEGPLAAMLIGRNNRQIGRALEQAEGKTFDDLKLVRMGKDRNRVALWQVLPV